MKTLILSIWVLACAQIAVSQNLPDRDANTAVSKDKLTSYIFSTLTPPEINGPKEVAVNNFGSYYYTSTASGVLEYECHVEPEEYSDAFYYPSGVDIKFLKTGWFRVECKARYASGWSEYKTLNVFVK